MVVPVKVLFRLSYVLLHKCRITKIQHECFQRNIMLRGAVSLSLMIDFSHYLVALQEETFKCATCKKCFFLTGLVGEERGPRNVKAESGYDVCKCVEDFPAKLMQNVGKIYAKCRQKSNDF